MLPVVPLSEAYSNNPVNEDLLTNVPADDDPIWLNGGGSTDNYITYLVMNGVLAPGQ
jgi:hypothetical protein